jgi:hypothetical protein
MARKKGSKDLKKRKARSDKGVIRNPESKAWKKHCNKFNAYFNRTFWFALGRVRTEKRDKDSNLLRWEDTEENFNWKMGEAAHSLLGINKSRHKPFFKDNGEINF